MFNKTIARRYIKSNWKMFSIISFTLGFFMFMMISIYGRILESGSSQYNNLTLFIGNAYFQGLGLLLPMIFVITVCNKIIALQVDKGSMAGTLSTPTTRNQITFTNLICFVISLFLMFAIIYGTGICAAEIFQPGQLELLPFTRIIVGGFIFQSALSGICFFSSCLFNTSRKSLAFGAGICIGFYVISMIQRLEESLSFFKYFTINTLFDTVALFNGKDIVLQLITLSLIAVIGYISGIIVFKKRDLPL